MITIGIPFYNDEKYLEFAINSVFKQTYQNWKLILVNDGGNDNSLSIAQKYEEDPRVSIIDDGENRKLPYRLNQLIRATKTKYYARMDADDIMHPQRIEKQVKILEENPYIDVLGTNAYSIDDKNIIQGVRMTISNELTECSGFIHPSISGKTSWFRENSYDERLSRAQDYELWKRTQNQSVFRVLSEPLLYYREYGFDYYKKYFQSLSSKLYAAKKLDRTSIYVDTFRTSLVGTIYYFSSLIGKEDLLIKRRIIPLSKEELDIATKDLLSISTINESIEK